MASGFLKRAEQQHFYEQKYGESNEEPVENGLSFGDFAVVVGSFYKMPFAIRNGLCTGGEFCGIDQAEIGFFISVDVYCFVPNRSIGRAELVNSGTVCSE